MFFFNERKPRPAETPRWLAQGLKGFPECPECQCYPECRKDCPDRAECLKRLPEYQRK